MDEELIDQARRGDKAAYRKLFDKYSGRILGYLCKYMGDYHKAEDAMIETFLDVYRRLPRYKESGKFLSWVYAIAINFAKKEFRKKSGKDVSLDALIGEDGGQSIGDTIPDDKLRPDRAAITKESEQLINNSILALDEKYRSVLVLCDIQDTPYEEAAGILGLSKTALGVRLNRARKMLYDVLKRAGYIF